MLGDVLAPRSPFKNHEAVNCKCFGDDAKDLGQSAREDSDSALDKQDVLPECRDNMTKASTITISEYSQYTQYK